MVLTSSVVLALVVLALYLATCSATVVQLTSANYTSYLHDVLDPETNVAMEYYAGWCPHCKHFAPTYDLVGAHFMDTEQPKVIVARTDCAVEVCLDSFQLISVPGMNCRLLIWLSDGANAGTNEAC
jgi:thiol-disulfide isomerase/thioredoxin